MSTKPKSFAAVAKAAPKIAPVAPVASSAAPVAPLASVASSAAPVAPVGPVVPVAAPVAAPVATSVGPVASSVGPVATPVATPVAPVASAASSAAHVGPVGPVASAAPTGPWTIYYHEITDDQPPSGTDIYKFLCVVSTFDQLGTVLREFGPKKLTNCLVRIMRGKTSPLWENSENIRGGSYCLKIPIKHAVDVFETYVAAVIIGECTSSPSNTLVGVTISPKKGSCIIKIWNKDCKSFHDPTDLKILHPEVRHEEIIYRPHTEQRM